MTPTASHRLLMLDIARFVAAIMVMLFHFGAHNWLNDQYQTIRFEALEPLAQYGYLGVPLFFMISGFVISLSAANARWAPFAVARAVRIYPALWIAGTLSFICIRTFGHDHPHLHTSVPQYLSSIFLVHSFIGIRALDGVYWSLVAEMTFYGWITLILLFKQFHHLHWFMWGWVIATLPFFWFDPFLIDRIFIPESSGYFIAGVAFFGLYQARRNAQPTQLTHWGLLLASVALNAVHLAQQNTKLLLQYPLLTREISVIYLIMLSFYGFFLVMIFSKPRYASPFWVQMGLLTYPLYLLHNSVAVFVINRLMVDDGSKYFQLFGLMIVCIVGAWLFHRILEKPFTRFIKTKLSRFI